MYIKNKNYDNALRKVRIEIGKLIGLETDAEAYLVLKEMDTLTTLKMKGLTDDTDKLIEFFKDVLPSLIVEHNFYETEDKKMTHKDVANFIFEKLEVSTKVVEEYSSAIFRIKPAAEDGDKVSEQGDISESLQSGTV